MSKAVADLDRDRKEAAELALRQAVEQPINDAIAAHPLLALDANDFAPALVALLELMADRHPDTEPARHVFAELLSEHPSVPA